MVNYFTSGFRTNELHLAFYQPLMILPDLFCVHKGKIKGKDTQKRRDLNISHKEYHRTSSSVQKIAFSIQISIPDPHRGFHVCRD